MLQQRVINLYRQFTMSINSHENTKAEHLLGSIKNRNLQIIAEKVIQGVPVNESDTLAMLATNDILELGSIANYLKSKLHGDAVYYSILFPQNG